MDRPAQKGEVLTVKLRAGLRRVGAAGRPVLLAVSGGADSMALLDAAARLAGELRMRCSVGSIDHGLRAGSAREVARVAREARRRELPFFSAALALRPGSSVEERARRARYEALERLRIEAGAELIATAHTATDQAETLLMRLARGASLSGAAAVLPVRGRVVRPMLACTREEVRAYLLARRLRHVDDPMNADAAYLRTRLRSDVLPALERAAGPGAAERLARFAELAGEDSELLEAWALAAQQRLTLDDGALDAAGLRALQRPIRRRVFARLLREADLPADLAAIALAEDALLEERAGATWPGGAILRAGGGRVRVERGAPAESPGTADELVRDGPAVGAGGRLLRWTTARPEGEAQPVHSASERLVVRARRAGDRVKLPGGRTRKLQDVLVDARVPRERRDQALLLAEPDGAVVCVVGVWPRVGARPGASVSWVSSAPLAAKQADIPGAGYKGVAGAPPPGRRGRSK